MFDFFLPFDTMILSAEHILAMIAGSIFTPTCKFISFLGKDGITVYLIAFILFFNKKTRKFSIALAISVCVTYLLNNMVLKQMFVRLRPFQAYDIFKEYWEAAGAIPKSGNSFPSGHTATITAACFVIVFLKGKEVEKRYIFIAILAPCIMAFSRTYLMHHYPSDCIFGFIFGITYALATMIITNTIYNILEKREDKLSKFILEWSLFK